MFGQVDRFMEPFLSKYRCRFRQRYSAQCCLIAMIEKWKSAIDKGASFGAFKKALDCLLHEVLLAKLQGRNQGGQRVSFPICAFWNSMKIWKQIHDKETGNNNSSNHYSSHEGCSIEKVLSKS